LKTIYWTLLLLIIGSTGFAQLDEEHFIPPIYPSTHGWLYPRDQVVYLSTPTTTPFNYSILDGAGNILQTGVISNANPISYKMTTLPSDFVVQDADLNKVLTDRGIHIVADDKVYCNLRANAGGGTRPNATSMTAKGHAALGKAFRVGHFPSPQNFNDAQNSLATKSSTVGIYATEDNTTISIDLTSRQPVLRGAGAPSTANIITITLNRGETYVFAIKSTDSNLNRNTGMIGGLITSDKDIVVNCGSWGGNLANKNVTDIGIDQIVGVDKIGTEYAVVRGALTRDNPNHEMVMIVAHEPNTVVTVNGVVVATIANAGGFYKIPASRYSNQGAMYIETSVPAYAYQFMMGANDYNYKTQGMNFLPPISCRTTNFVDNIPFIEKIGGKTYGGAVSIVTTKGATLTVTANGVNKNIGTPIPVPASNYEQYKVSGLTGNVAVYSNTIALVSIVGQNGDAGYGGFFSGFVDNEIDDAVNCLPGYIFEPSGRYQTYQWFKDGVEITGATNDSLFATETGEYTFEYTLASCKDTSDTIHAVALNEFELQGDTTFCSGDSVEWSIVGSGFDSLSWETGEQTQTIFVDTDGETDVRIYSDITKECYIDTMVPSIELILPIIVLRDTTACSGESIVINSDNIGNTVLWSTGETSQSITIDQPNTYKITVTNPDGCSDSTKMVFTNKSCNTDAAITKTDNRDDYTPGTTSEYTIVAKNLGPNDFFNGVVDDPLPAGISAGDVAWNATVYGDATTGVVGSQTGALNDIVNIPVGDSIVYSVNIAIPPSYTGDFTNIATISVDIDTNATNDTAIDIDENGLCSGATISSFAEQFNTGVKTNPGQNDPNWKIQWINDPAYYHYPANNYAIPTSNTVIPAVGMNKAAGVWADASYPDYLWVCYPWIGDNNGPGKHVDVDRDGINQEYSGGTAVSGTGDAVTLKFSKTFEMTAAQLEASELSFSIAADNEIMDIIVNGVSQGPKALGSYQLIPHKITQDFQLGTNTIEIIVNSGPGFAGMMIANSTIKAVDSVSLMVTDPPLDCAPVSVDITDSLWTVGSINVTTLNYFTDDSITIPFTNPTTADSGTYFIVATNLVGCSDTAVINVGSNPNPDVDLRNDTAFCEGGNITIDAGLFDSWNWNVGGETGQTITVDSTDEYKVVVTNVFHCSDSDSVVITVNPLPIVELRNDTAICFGDSLDLDAQNLTASYLWNTSETAQTLKIGAAGTYEVTVTDSNTCMAVDEMTLSLNALPIVQLRNDTIVCSPEVVVVGAGVWDSYLWSNGSISDEITLTSTDTVYVDIIDINQCAGSDTIGVQVIDLPIVDLGNDTAICDGETVTIDAENVGLNFDWITNETTQTIDITATGIYGVKVTDIYGCLGSDSMELIINALPIVGLGNDTIICEPESITINAGVWDSYLWNTRENTQYITVDSTSSINVSIIDTNGCRGSDEIEIQVNPLPIVDLGNDTTICKNETVTLDAENTGWNYAWNSGETTQTLTVSEGFFKVTVSDAIGCNRVDSITVVVDLIPDPYPKKQFEICEGDNFDLEPDNGFGAFDINWPGLSTTTVLNVDDTGDYYSAVSSDYCTDTFKLTVTKIDTPDISILNLLGRNTACFDYENIQLSILDLDLIKSNYEWSTGETTNDIEVIEEGTYLVTASNRVCESIKSINIEEYCLSILYIPNAFTPNGEMVNDIFMPRASGEITNYQLLIFDRWGEQIFATTNLYEGWNGTFKGGDCQIDVYIYKASYDYISESQAVKTEVKIGTVTLLR
jgi:gliding motility-associated-like protein/uncharacterized repeat protein (TIGR01451 family)